MATSETSSHSHPLRRGPERHPEAAQQSARLFVRPRRRADRDLHAAQPVDLVVLDLREDELLLEAERVVPASVETLVGHALEVPDARERHGHELLEEMPHPLAPQRHLETDGHADTQTKVRDGFLRLRHDRTLSRDLREIAGRGVHRLRFGVVLGNVDAGDDHGLIARPRFLDAAALAAVLARDDHHLVALAEAHAASHLLQDLRCERNDLHEVALAKLARDGAKDAGSPGLVLWVEENGGVVVEPDERAIGAAI